MSTIGKDNRRVLLTILVVLLGLILAAIGIRLVA